jgi:hypothetical protein
MKTTGQTSVLRTEFEPWIPVFNEALDAADTGVDHRNFKKGKVVPDA